MMLKVRSGNTVISWYSQEAGPGPQADTKICGCSKSLTVSPPHLSVLTHGFEGPATQSFLSVLLAFFACQSGSTELLPACCVYCSASAHAGLVERRDSKTAWVGGKQLGCPWIPAESALKL